MLQYPINKIVTKTCNSIGFPETKLKFYVILKLKALSIKIKGPIHHTARKASVGILKWALTYLMLST